jgi:lysophospholipase L1-like esterase
MKRLILAIMIVCFMTVPANAATKYVDFGAGTDTGGCGAASGASACKTVSYMLTGNRTVQGDTVQMAAGTYEEPVTVVEMSGAAATTIIHGNGTVNFNIHSGVASYVFFTQHSLKFQNINFTDTTPTGMTLMRIYASVNVYFEDCTFDLPGSAYATIFPYGDGFTINVYFTRCKIANTTHANGFILNTWAALTAFNTYFYSCSAWNNTYIVADTLGSTTVVAKNNTFVSPVNTFFSLNATGGAITAHNNIFGLTTGKYGIGLDATGTTWDVDYNVYWTTETPFDTDLNNLVYQNGTNFLPIGGHNRLINPAFTNYAANPPDLTLATTSYAAGRGSATNHPPDNLDITGVAFGTNDVGCYKNPAFLPVALTKNKVVFLGDSIMYGYSADVGSKVYETFATLVPKASVVAGTNTAVSGIFTRAGILFVDYVMVTQSPKIVYLSIGVNDATSPKAGQTASLTAVEIEKMIVKIKEYGAIPIWLGVPSVIGDPPDNTFAKAVNAAVDAYCTTSGDRYGDILTEMEKNTDWKTDYYADLTSSPHPDNDGHALYASLAKGLYPSGGGLMSTFTRFNTFAPHRRLH